MAPKEHGTIIILDIGRNVSSSEEPNENSFFLKAKECAARIIERKVMTQPKNLVGITLLGSKKTNNNMANQVEGAFRHITVLSQLQTPTWQMIRDLPEEPSMSRGDWFDALIVAADQFKEEMERANILHKKIILMTNFQSPSKINDDQVEMVINGFKEDNLEVDIIGLDIYDQNLKGDDIELARHFVQTTKGANATFDYAMQYLLFHKKKATNANPWNVDLTIGPNIKIPVSSYLRLKDEPVVKSWKKAIKDPVTSTSSTTEGVMRNRLLINTENQTAVEAEDVIKGYHYGEQIIPLSECDKTMLYESGEKCLSIYGFTHADNIKWQNLNGDGLTYVFGRKGDKKAQYALKCLVESLHELNLVGIVRRVYNRGYAPKMFALMPVIDTNDFVCLSMTAICFKEDIKNMAFPETKLKKFACTKEQVNAFKDLIQAMDLTSAYDDTFDDAEAFPIAETVSPTAQYVLDCIAYRALNPGKPLPQPRDDIMMLFKIPPLIEKRSREPLDKLKDLLELKKVEAKPKRRAKAQDRNYYNTAVDQPSNIDQSNEDLDMPKVQLPLLNNQGSVRIGTIDPIDDFQTLRNNGKTLADLAPDMTDAIESLIYCNLDGNYSKAFNTMAYFRGECVKSDPSPYNTWLHQFKNALISRNNVDVCNKINEKNLGLILKKENHLSAYNAENSHDDSQLYENDTVPDDTELSIRPEINDLYDEI